jgi:2-dehydropantoate 2-reductase
MRILIVGAGGLGGYFGAYLLNAGRDVTFLVRPRRAQQLRLHGLQLEAPTGDLTLPAPKTVLAGEIAGAYDLVLLSCKAWDLESAMGDFAPAVGDETAILPLLNGIAHLDTLDARFGRERVLGGLTSISAVKEADGRIVHLNRLDLLQFGDRDAPDSPRIHRVADTLSVPGYSAELVPNIVHQMWQKWLSISAAAGITCLMRAAVGDIVAAGAAHYVHQLLAETASIATAEGFGPTQDFLDTTLAKFTQAGSLFTASMLRDLESGGPIEAQQIVGDLLAHGRRRAVATPLLEVAHAHLRCYEERRQREMAARPGE